VCWHHGTVSKASDLQSWLRVSAGDHSVKLWAIFSHLCGSVTKQSKLVSPFVAGPFYHYSRLQEYKNIKIGQNCSELHTVEYRLACFHGPQCIFIFNFKYWCWLLKVMRRKNIKEFPNKGWGTAGTEQTFEKLQETGTTAGRSSSIESLQNISCFCILSYLYTNWML